MVTIIRGNTAHCIATKMLGNRSLVIGFVVFVEIRMNGLLTVGFRAVYFTAQFRPSQAIFWIESGKKISLTG